MINFFKHHKLLFLLIIVLFILLITLFLNNKKENKDSSGSLKTSSSMTSSSYPGNMKPPSESSVKSPEVEEPKKVNMNSDRYISMADKYSVAIPKGYSVLENTETVYFRANDNSQIAIISCDGTFSSGTDISNQFSTKLERLKMVIKDSSNIVKERSLSYPQKVSSSEEIIGSRTVLHEQYNADFRNIGEGKSNWIDLDVYYVPLANNKGLIITGSSQAIDIYSIETSLIESIKEENPKEESLDLALYESPYTDNMKLYYPKDWEKTTTGDLVTFKAPKGSSSRYSGCILQYYVDNKNKVEDYAQFSKKIETDIIIPSFVQTVLPSDFSMTTEVNSMDLNAKLQNKDAVKFNITDTIYPISKAVKNSMLTSDGKIYSQRYGFHAGGKNCMINFIYTKGDTGEEQLLNKIIEKISVN